jgi:hypothetical protein
VTDFINDPIRFLETACTQPVVDLDLFSTGQTVPVISGAEVNQFVYSHPDLWDYSLGRQAFREAFGDRYITLLSGVEYHENQRQFQNELRVELDEPALREIVKVRLQVWIRNCRLSVWARELAIELLWKALHPCDPVPLRLLDRFEDYFQRGAGLPVFGSYFQINTWPSLCMRMQVEMNAHSGEDFALKAAPFIAGIRALSTAIEWLVLGRCERPPADLYEILRFRPPFILFPLYPKDDFQLWNYVAPNDEGEIAFASRWIKKGELVFHAMCIPQWKDSLAPLALFGGGMHKCPGRHLVKRLLQLVLWELTMTDDLRLTGGDGIMDAKFNGLLVPKYDWRFE